MEKIKQLTSDNLVDNNIEALKQLFPTAFAEGKVVMEELQALLGDYVEKDKEYYEFNWAGKHLARQEANKVSTGTLRPCKEESKNWDDTQNLYIEGDNLEVLKLLQKTYSNKVKMIYIDPPYNTGKDFVYKDNYKDNLNNYLEISGQLDEDGKKLSSNTESDGRYHSNWLNMMYPRLRLARNLLTEDGVIFISIDDNEQANLKKLCDEVFGEENFVANVIWRKKYGIQNDAKYFSESHDYVLCYSKMKSSFVPFPLPRTEEQDRRYKNVDDDPRGVWKSGDLSVGRITEKDRYIIVTPSGRKVSPPEGRSWVVSEDTFKELVLDNRIWFGLTGNNVPSVKFFLNEVKQGVTPSTFWDYNEVGHTDGSNKFLKSLFNNKQYFDYPKPVELIERCIRIASNSDSFILDFFSGSSTTAHAVMALNAEDGGSRRCISVQLPEPTEEKSEAYKAGYNTIAEIGKERIRRAGAKIAEEIAKKVKELEAKIEKLSKELPTDETKAEIAKLKSEIQNLNNQDLGFRVFKLDSSNIKSWDTTPSSLEQQLEMFDEAIKSDRTEEDMLYEILLKYGLDLSTPIMEKVVDGCTIYNVGFGSLYVCLSENIQPTVAQAIADWHKDFEDANPNVIFSDSGFNGNDAAKTNAVQTLRQMGIENVRSI